MRVLGIDPGYARCGWGIVELKGDPVYVAHGCIETPSTWKPHIRLRHIGDACAQIIASYVPTRMAMETLYFKQSTTTALGVAQARGVLFYIAAVHGLDIDEMTPTQVKTSVTGYGKADKLQMQEMVRLQLRLAAIPTPDDAADALAVAICGAVCSRSLRLS